MRYAIAYISLQQPVKRNLHLADQPVPPGHQYRGKITPLLLTCKHTHGGPRRAPLPWEPFLIRTGTKWEEMPKSSVLKPLLLLPEHPRKHAMFDLSLALSIPCCKVGSNSSLLLLAVLRSPDPRAHGCNVLGSPAASSDEAPVVKRGINWLTPWVLIYLHSSLAKTYRISLH